MRKVSNKGINNIGTLGGRIEKERLLRGLSQKELANQLGISREKINYIEKNKPNRNLTIKELGEIADFFEVSTDYLMCRVNIKKMTDIRNLENDTIEFIKEISINRKVLELFNNFLKELEDTNFLQDLKVYLILSYFIENILEKTMNRIYKNKKILESDINKINVFIIYLEHIKYNKIEHYDYLKFLVNKNEKLFDYMEDFLNKIKNNNMNFDEKQKETTEEIKQIFINFRESLYYNIADIQIKNVIDGIKGKVVNDDNYYISIKNFMGIPDYD